MNKMTGKRAVLYARLAQKSYADERYSLGNPQLAKMRAYAERMNLEIVGEFVDEGCSGLKRNRPQLAMALKLANNHGCDVFIVADMARLSRSWQQFPDILKQLKKHEVTVISLAEPETDFSEPAAIFLYQSLAIESHQLPQKKFRQKYSRMKNHPPA